MAEKRYNTGHGVETLTEEGMDLLRRCWKANPNGCRSADGECGPPPTYPCQHHAGVSLDEFWDTLVPFFKEEEALLSG